MLWALGKTFHLYTKPANAGFVLLGSVNQRLIVFMNQRVFSSDKFQKIAYSVSTL
jgi:hypothetical protein